MAVIKTFHNDIILRLLIDRRYRIFRHVVLTLLLAAAFYNSKMGFPEPASTYVRLSIFLIVLALFHLNVYWLVPKFLFKDNYLGYFLWNIFLFILAHVIGFYSRLFIINYFNEVVPQKEQ